MKSYISALLLAVFTFMAHGAALSADLITVKAEGVSARSGTDADIKKTAIDLALKGAVAGAVKSVLKEDALAANSALIEANIYARASGFVLNYKILSEGWITHMDGTAPLPLAASDEAARGPAGLELYHIWVEASIDASQLKGALNQIITPEDKASTIVTLNILDVADYDAFIDLKASLERIPMIKELSYNSFYRGRITLTAKASGDAVALSERIAKELQDRYTVIPGAGQTILIRPAPKEAQPQ